MTTIEIRLSGTGECEILHEASGVTLRTSKSPEYGGTGTSFSSTDLLAAALGSCIATDLEPVAVRHGVSPSSIIVRVGKRLSLQPKRIDSLTVDIETAGDVGDGVLLRLERAAQHCLVHRSLAEGIEVVVRVRRRDGNEGEGEGEGEDGERARARAREGATEVDGG